ncbi:putative MFS family arabinose efflux permease [Marinobacterium sp. MBR-111]|uniref:MFS transporter n=1 Tax=Marinobacterium sp. MBR-111 TaxID=3156463 RepID=UPI0033932499
MEAIRKHLPESWSLVLSAFAAAYGIGLLALLALPYMISAVISDLGLDEAQAGYLLSAEFMCMMLASLLVAPLMGRAPRKTMALLGAAIAVIGNLMSAHITDITSLTLMRCLVGAGCGLAFACGNATVSSARDPDNVAGYMNLFFVAMMTVVMVTFASAMAEGGLAGVYYALAITQAIMMLPVFLMKQKASTESHPHHHIGSNKKLMSGAAIAIMVATFLFSTRDTMGWAFVEQVGVRVGYDGETLGFLFSLQALVGLVGPLAVAVIGKRLGVGTPVILGILLTGASSLFYVLGETSKLMYTIGVMAIAATYFYTLAYLTSLAAFLDSEGRLAAACGAFLTLGIAVGPSISGTLISWGGYTATAWGIAIAVGLTLVAVMIPLAHAKERHEAVTAAMAEVNATS